MTSLILIILPCSTLCKVTTKHQLEKRKTLEINEIPHPNYDEGSLRCLESSPNSDGFWEVRSFGEL